MNKFKTYIGVKIVQAKEMDKATARKLNFLRADDKSTDNVEGMLVKYTNDYTSWCPKDAFMEYNRPINSMTFGMAVEMMRAGKKVARAGWNGKGMYVVLMPGYPDGIEVNEATSKAHLLEKGAMLKYRPYYQLFTAQKDIAMWSPSTSDTLGEDWYVVD